MAKAGLSVLLAAVAWATPAGSVTFEEVEGIVGQVRVLVSRGPHPEDSTLWVDRFEFASAAVVDADLLLTAAHAVTRGGESLDSIEVWDHVLTQYRPCRVLALAAGRDLAALHCPGYPYAGLTLADAPPVVSATLYLAGYPAFAYRTPRMVMSKGALLGISASLPGAEVFPDRRNLYLVDIPAYDGQSGGPVFNERLELVAIVTRSAQASDGRWSGSTFGIGADELRPFLATAKRRLAAPDAYRELLDRKNKKDG